MYRSVTCAFACRDTSLIRNSPPLSPYGRRMPGARWWLKGGARFLMREVPLCRSLGPGDHVLTIEAARAIELVDKVSSSASQV